MYGNRYRSRYEEVDKGLSDAEVQFFKGNYTSLRVYQLVVHILQNLTSTNISYHNQYEGQNNYS